MARNGKIANLPSGIRDTLNSRIENGDPGMALVAWLNNLPEVQSTLAESFQSRPITEQNLSEWKQGGFREWQQQQKVTDRFHSFLALSEHIEGSAEGFDVPERLAYFLAVELASETSRLLEATTDPKQRWQYLCESLRQLKSLRQGDHAAARTALERQRFEVESERLEKEEEKRAIGKLWNEALRPAWRATTRNNILAMFGNDENAAKAAAYFEWVSDLLEDPFNSPVPPPFDPTKIQVNPTEIQPDPTESDQIQPNPTKNI
jgi:hypothetical protein